MPTKTFVDTDSNQTLSNKSITVTSTGSTTARQLADRFAEQFHVYDFGAVCNGTTDDTAAIQAAINAAGAAGGGRVIFPPKVCAIATGLINTFNNVLLWGQGRGGESTHAVKTDYLTAGTTLKWTGAAGGTMYNMGPTAGSAYDLYGGGIQRIFFEGNSVAGTGVLLRAVRGAEFDLTVEETTVVGLDLTVENTVTGDPIDLQHNWFQRVVTIQESPTGGIGIRLRGNPGGGGNTSLNHFGFLQCHLNNSVGLDIGQSDGNVFEHVQVHGAGNYGIVFRAGTTPEYARDNVIFYAQPGGMGVKVEGLASGSTPSKKNAILHYSRENGVAAPTIEAGASFSYNDFDNTVMRHSRVNSSVITDYVSTGSTAGQNVAKFDFKALNSTPEEISYANITASVPTTTAGAEDGRINFTTKVAGADAQQLSILNGVILGAPAGAGKGSGSLNISGDYYNSGAAITGRETVTYSASMTPDQSLGATHLITPTDANAFTINTPINSQEGTIVCIRIKNTTGGALGAITAGANYKLTAAWPTPANGTSSIVTFVTEGTTKFIEVARSNGMPN